MQKKNVGWKEGRKEGRRVWSREEGVWKEGEKIRRKRGWREGNG